MIVDGAKSLDTAVTQTFGRAALLQRCQVHKGRNILEHLPEASAAVGEGGPQERQPDTDPRQDSQSSAAEPSDRARTLTTRVRPRACGKGSTRRFPCYGLGLSERFQRTLATTNAIECLCLPNAPRAAPCETLARRDDGAALGGRRGARSYAKGFQRVQGFHGMSATDRCPPSTRRAVRTRGVVRDGCVVVNQAAAEFQQRTGHPPPMSGC